MINALFMHQKELFTNMKNLEPKLIFYIAPTGTGKTLSPIGLSESYKIIFVCAVTTCWISSSKGGYYYGKMCSICIWL